MGILQSDKVIFYHPCNDKTEFTQTEDWDESTPTYPAGKVSNALAGTAGTTPAFGTENEFESGITGYTTTTKLTATTFLAGWVNSAETEIRCKVATVSGSDITFGAQHVVVSGANLTTQGGRWAALDSTHVVAAYRASNTAYANVLTISGNDVTAGAAHSPAASVQFPLAVPLTSTKFVFVYRDTADSSKGTAKVGTVSGTDITFGAEHEFHSAGEATELDACALSSTKIVVVYNPANDGPFHGVSKVGIVSGTDITFGTDKKYTGNGQSDSRCCALDSTHFAVVYADNGNSARCGTKVGLVSGTDITFGAETLATTDGVSKPIAIPLSSTTYATTIAVAERAETTMCVAGQEVWNRCCEPNVTSVPLTVPTLDAPVPEPTDASWYTTTNWVADRTAVETYTAPFALRNSVSAPHVMSVPDTVPTLAVPWLESALSWYATTNLVADRTATDTYCTSAERNSDSAPKSPRPDWFSIDPAAAMLPTLAVPLLESAWSLYETTNFDEDRPAPLWLLAEPAERYSDSAPSVTSVVPVLRPRHDEAAAPTSRMARRRSTGGPAPPARRGWRSCPRHRSSSRTGTPP